MINMNPIGAPITTIGSPTRPPHIDIAPNIDIDIAWSSVIATIDVDIVAIDVDITPIYSIGTISTSINSAISAAIDIIIVPTVDVAISTTIDLATIFAIAVHCIPITGLSIDSIT